MAERMDISNADKESKKFIDFLNKEKRKLLMLPYLCVLLMVLESIVNMYTNIIPVIIGTFVLTCIVHIYTLVKLDIYKINIGNILSAISNKMTLKEWANIEPNTVIEKNLKIVRISWRSLILEYVIVYVSILICLYILFSTVIRLLIIG